jgi:hypothetical protein
MGEGEEHGDGGGGERNIDIEEVSNMEIRGGNEH